MESYCCHVSIQMTAGNISSSKQETSKTDYHVGTCQFLIHVEKTPVLQKTTWCHACIYFNAYICDLIPLLFHMDDGAMMKREHANMLWSVLAGGQRNRFGVNIRKDLFGCLINIHSCALAFNLFFFSLFPKCKCVHAHANSFAFLVTII